jgi:hypothetical protein
VRTLRLLLAAAALAGTAAAATPASADPIVLCRFWLDGDHPIAETYGLPVYAAVPGVRYAC